MTIQWRQVLEIETYLNNLYEQYATIEQFLWRHPQSINSGVRISKDKEYTFEDVHEYLTSKYPNDEMIKKNIDGIRQLFKACLGGSRICSIDPELLEINEFQDHYRLSKEVLKNNIINRCSAYTGTTAYYLHLLKHIIDTEKRLENFEEINDDTREYLRKAFANYDIENPKLEENHRLLKENILEFMNNSRFRAFNSSCVKNNFPPPYSSDTKEEFVHDVLTSSKAEVIAIINRSSTELFAFKIRRNESPYPEDLRRTDLGDINVYTTLYGMFNFDKILNLKSNNKLLNYIQQILNQQFEILPIESINDDYNPAYTVSGNRYNSSIIIGTNLDKRKLYNEFVDEIHEKVISGHIWFNDDVNGIPYDYLNFHSQTDYSGEFNHSMSFTNVISSYHIAYLEKARIERDYEDLKNNGYFNTKEDYIRDMGGDY